MAKKFFLLFMALLWMQIMLKGCGAVKDAGEGREGVAGVMLRELADDLGKRIYSQFAPYIAFSTENEHGIFRLLEEQIECLLPFYGYLAEDDGAERKEALDLKTIMLAEAQEGSYFEEEPDLSGEPGLAAEDGAGQQEDELARLLQAENEAALGLSQPSQDAFVPHVRQNQVELALLDNYETLVQQFYTIDANTMVGSDQLNVGRFLESDMSISKEGEAPQILIYHTHSQEMFADSVPGDPATSIMGVGDRLTDILQEQYGYSVLHYLGQYDVDARDDAYSNALPDIEGILKANPSIQVVIDLHRDEMPEGTRLVMDLDGRPTARFMFFNGLSRTKKTGNIAYLYNENLDGNLAFSFQMQLKAMEYYPGLTRKIYLKGYRYNMHLCPRYLLIELGAQNNTLEEALNACEPLAHILDMVLSGE